MNQGEAAESVDALLGDLKFIMGTRPHTGWPEMATAALEHHDPMIPEHLLEWQTRRFQRAALLTLRGLAASDADIIRSGILDILAIERMAMAPTPPPVAPTPDDLDRQSTAQPVAEPSLWPAAPNGSGVPEPPRPPQRPPYEPLRG